MNPELPAPSPNPLRRILLIIMTLLVSAIMGQALIHSWNEPQVASRLELYQTDLLLQATAWDGSGLPEAQVVQVRRNLLGTDPLVRAQKAYESVRETAIAALSDRPTPEESEDATASSREQSTLQQQAELLDLIDLRLGILQAVQGDPGAAIATWQGVQTRNASSGVVWRTSAVLQDLWQAVPVPPESDRLVTETLRGWFRNRALEQFYTQGDAAEALIALLEAETQQAERTLGILALVGVVPAIGCFLGTALLLLLGLQRLLRGKESLWARNSDQGWETPWTGETVWQVLMAGFLFLGQVVVPLLISPLGGVLGGLGSRGRALYALLYYGAMATGAIAVLLVSIRRYRPLSRDWFRFTLGDNWVLWGLGGYLVALPLMLSISLLNQGIWQGQGGSNPLLQAILEEQDPVALGLFFFTAAIAAPLFEEFLFRGFLLPSLTRYVPVGGAIVLSSLIFAVAHLSLSEILPLTVLGMVLGLVYTRSRNLLAPMLLHSAWNSVTMAGLFLLGSSVN